MTVWLLMLTRDHHMYNEFDIARGFVIIAESAQQARELAAKRAGDEGAGAWLDPLATICDQVQCGDTAWVVLRDYRNG